MTKQLLTNGRKSLYIALSVSILLSLIFFQAAIAQNTFTLSKNADFSTDDRVFAASDTLYMHVSAMNIDHQQLKKQKWELKGQNTGHKIHGTFLNNGNGTYTSFFALSDLPTSDTQWKWEADIEDFSRGEFKAEAMITIGNDSSSNYTLQEFEGEITAVDLNSLYLDGQQFLLDDSTVIVDKNHTPLTVDDLAVGQKAEVKAFLQDGYWTARYVEIHTKNDPKHEYLEIKGAITELGDNYMYVQSQKIYVNDQTVYEREHHASLSFSDLTVGDVVEVKAVYQTDSSLLAVKVDLESDDDMHSSEVKGVIEEIGPNSLVVAGINIYVDSQTMIYGHDHQSYTFSDLQVGMKVEVEAQTQADGTLLAKKIEVHEEGRETTEFNGVIDEVRVNSVIVSGQEFFIDSVTVIQDEKDQPLSLTDLEVGQHVEVKAVKQADGTWLALKLEVKEMYQMQTKIEGWVEEVGADYLVVSGFTIYVDDQTKIYDEQHSPLNFSDIQVDQRVEVKAQMQQNGGYLATRIEVKNSNSHNVEIRGAIEEIGTDYLVVSGVTVGFDSLTVVYNETYQQISLSDLSVGVIVEIKALQNADGSLMALEIKIDRDPANLLQSSGQVNDVTSSSVSIGAPEFLVDNQTVIIDNAYQLTDLSAIQQGDQITVWAKKQPDNSLKAIQIQIQATTLDVSGSGSNSNALLKSYTLHQNYPNPFNPETAISFELPYAEKVTLKIFNMNGQEVATLVNGNLSSGNHTIKFNATNLPSGVYFYSIKAGSFSSTKRMLLLK